MSDAGGYGVKLAPGHWTLTLSGGPLQNPQVRTVDVGTTNIKVDFALPAVINAQPAVGIPTVTGPTSATTAAPPTFTWTASAGAARYYLWVDNVTTGQQGVIQQWSLTTNSYTPATALAAGTYKVWAQAVDSNNNASGWSAVPLEFTVVATV